MDELNNQVPEKKNGLAVAGMIVGIVSIIFNFYCITGVIGLILSLVGLKKSKETGAGKGMSIAGVICSIVGIIVGIFAIITLIKLMSVVGDSVNEIDSTMKILNSL